MDIKSLQDRLAQFAAERDWDQFHTPKNLAIALSVEASELLEHFQWLTAEQSQSITSNDKVHHEISLEAADVLFYLLRICDRLEIDLPRAVEEKLRINAQKYPVEVSRGNATKYSRRGVEE